VHLKEIKKNDGDDPLGNWREATDGNRSNQSSQAPHTWLTATDQKPYPVQLAHRTFAEKTTRYPIVVE